MNKGYLMCLVVLTASAPAEAQTSTCRPTDRPLDGSCNGSGGHGRAGDPFIRPDGYEAASPSAPLARKLSNEFMAQDPWDGIGTFETVLIPFESLREGQNPQNFRGFRLNQFAVAFGQAVAHDLTKSRIGFNPAALGNPDFQYAPDDPLCQKVVVFDQTNIYYFSCTASHTSEGGTTTVTLADEARYTWVKLETAIP